MWQDGSCRSKKDRVHDSHNRQKEPVGDLGNGLHVEFVLEETSRAQDDGNYEARSRTKLQGDSFYSLR